MAGRFLESACVSGWGEAAASGQLSFYQVGTLTPATVFSDDALTQAVSQPIVLDSLGKSPYPLYSATALRAIVNLASGATLTDIERIDGDRAELVKVSNANWDDTDINSILSTLATSLGGRNGQFKDAGAGAVGRNINVKFSEVQVSVKDEGAAGNGVANDTTAIQAAINRIIQLGGGTVFFPPGTYNIASALSLPMGSNPLSVQLDGAGQLVSKIVQTSSSANTITCSGGSGTGLVIVTDMGLNATSTSGTAFASVSGLQVVCSNVSESGHENGFSSIAGFNDSSPCAFVNLAIASRAASAGVGMAAGGSVMVVNPGFVTTAAGAAYTALSVSGGGTTFSCSGGSITSATSKAVSIAAAAPSIISFSQTNIAGSVGNALVVAAANTSQISAAPVIPNVNDQRTGSPHVVSLSGTGNATVFAGYMSRITQNTPATTVTVTMTAGQIATLMGAMTVVACLNSSGGAVTWTFNAAIFTLIGAAPAPASGSRTSIIFVYDALTARHVEVGRA